MVKASFPEAEAVDLTSCMVVAALMNLSENVPQAEQQAAFEALQEKLPEVWRRLRGILNRTAG